MSKFLEDFLVTMPTTQRKKLLELLEVKQKKGLIRTNHELQAEFEKLLADMQSRENGPTFKARTQNERIDSTSFNENMNEIAFDLATIFEASIDIDSLVIDNKQLSRSLLSGIRKNIFSLESKVEHYKIIMENSDRFTDGIYEQFKAEELTETNEKALESLLKDRFNNYLSNDYIAENVGGSLQLSVKEVANQLSSNTGRKLARIDVLNRIGKPVEHIGHEIDKSIDASLNTYWAESILVDQPIVQNINNLWTNDYKDIPKDGAICEVLITLSGITTVSHIEFDPFCSYPLEIVAIYGYEGEDIVGLMYELISPDHKNPYQRSQKSVNKMVFQFPSVDISKLKILIRQENYIKENYVIDKFEEQNKEMFQHISYDPEEIEDYKDKHESMAQFNKKNEISKWSMYLKRLGEWGSSVKEHGVIQAAKNALDIIDMGNYKNPMALKLEAMSGKKRGNLHIEEAKAKKKVVNKISYLYGAYNILITGRKYQNQSIYISKPLPLSINATRISLSTEEKHHDIELGNELIDKVIGESYAKDIARVTDIEYYVTHKKNPNSSDWKALLPIQKKDVSGELLSGDLIQDTPPEFASIEKNGEVLISYSLRFPTKSSETLTLRRNGTPMNPNTYLVSKDGKKIAIYSKYYIASSVYTVDYKPTDDAWHVNFNESSDIIPTQYIDENGETGEFFKSLDVDNKIELKHKPYLFRKSLFKYNNSDNMYQQNQDKLKAVATEFPIIVRVNGEEYENITNYSTNSYDDNNLLNSGGKTFAQVGETIVFGQPEDGSKIENITVDYYYVTTNIRIKAILRRNSVENESITPALYSYHIRCHSYDLGSE